MGPDETRSSIIRVWQREQRGRSIAVGNCWVEDTTLSPVFRRERYRTLCHRWLPMAGGDGTSMAHCKASLLVNIAHILKVLTKSLAWADCCASTGQSAFVRLRSSSRSRRPQPNHDGCLHPKIPFPAVATAKAVRELGNLGSSSAKTDLSRRSVLIAGSPPRGEKVGQSLLLLERCKFLPRNSLCDFYRLLSHNLNVSWLLSCRRRRHLSHRIQR
jgi:hypothetical protein